MNRLFFLLGLLTALIVYGLARRACCSETCCEEDCDLCREDGVDPGLYDRGIAD